MSKITSISSGSTFNCLVLLVLYMKLAMRIGEAAFVQHFDPDAP